MPFALFNPSWTPFEFEYALKMTNPTRVIVQDQLLPTLISMTESIGTENIFILGQKIEGFRNLEEMIEDARLRATAPASPRPVKRDTLAYLVFSSGTTGFPKSR